MPRFHRTALLDARDFALTAGPFAAIAVGLLWAALWFLRPAPPTVVTLATGQAQQGAYAEFGRRGAHWLGQHGIDVRLRETQGGADARQAPPGEAKDDRLVALGSLFYEPRWLFYREDSASARLGRDHLETLTESPPPRSTFASSARHRRSSN